MAGKASDVELKSRFQVITPEMALEWVTDKTHNRTVRQSKVLEFAADMKAGKWRKTHQGIAFDEENRLIDGQHRLYAIIEADTDVEMMVTRGLPTDYILVIDSGLPRNLVDSIRLSDPASGIGSQHVAAARAMMIGLGGRLTAPRQEVAAFLEQHAEAINFAVDAFGTKKKPGITIAPVLGAVARAWYTQDRAKLQRFASILVSGMADPGTEAAAIKLREWLLAVRHGQRAQGKTRTGGTPFYGKAERGLKAFLRNEKIATLYPAADELFPLPAESGRTTRKRKAS